MASILRQLKKYQQTGLTNTEQKVDSKAVIVVPEHNHPFAEMIEAILRSAYPPEPSFDESRKEFTIKSQFEITGWNNINVDVPNFCCELKTGYKVGPKKDTSFRGKNTESKCS
jgi:hypothetical protein